MFSFGVWIWSISFFCFVCACLLTNERFLNWATCHRPYRIICNERGEPYLLRVKIFGYMPGKPSWLPISMYLHLFIRPDEERAIHNHPWLWSASLILVGGYTEERLHRNGQTFMRRMNPLMPFIFH